MPSTNHEIHHETINTKLTSAVPEQNVDDGLDRVNLTIIKKRFLELNQQRLDRLRQSLSTSQRIFLDLLPLLFHINHPALPGYGRANAPTGIRNFKLTNQHIKSARKLNSSFALQREINPAQDICGIYFMGSCSSIAHNNRSDIDIWVCPRSGLEPEQKQALTIKCDEIAAWAEHYSLETHFFVMEDEAFRQGQRADMDQEDCGNTQHFLLLDEFYRTSILIEGCMPTWWYVPPSFDEDYNNYANTLLGKRYLDGHTCIDFGTPGQIPAAEYISAGVWQLYKGIVDPYKALLKLLLIEVYAADFPNTRNLSNEIKHRLYSGNYNIDELDPYINIYRRIEEYLLAHNEVDRLELIRCCLYFKVGIKLSHAPENEDPDTFLRQQSNHPLGWKRNVMRKLVAEWGWRRPVLLKLDQREHWSFSEIKSEQARLIKELVHSYRFLSSLIKKHSNPENSLIEHSHIQHSHIKHNQASIETLSETEKPNNNKEATIMQRNSVELNLLGRQLYAAFEQKPHKIPRLTSAIATSTAQEALFFYQQPLNDNKYIWRVDIQAEKSNDSNEQDSTQTVLKQSENPAELLAWCITNGLADDSTRFHVTKGDHALSEYEIRQLYTSLANQLPTRVASSNTKKSKHTIKEIFARPAFIEKCIFVVNCGVDPFKAQSEKNIWKISEKNDPLAYGQIAESLISSVTLIATNSWGELFCYFFNGAEALNDCLIHYYTYAASNSEFNLPQRHILCACPTRPTAIINRLQTLMEDIDTCYFTPTDTTSTEFPIATNIDSTSMKYKPTQQQLEKYYIFQSAFGYHVFNWLEGQPNIQLFDNTSALLESISQPDNTRSLTIDPMALQDHPLSTIGRKLEAGRRNTNKSNGWANNIVTIFYEVIDDIAMTYLVDQQYSLAFAKIPYESLRSLVTPIRQFVEQNELRRVSTAELSELPEIKCYALKKVGSSYSATQVPTESRISANYLSVKAIGSKDKHGNIMWSIYCNDEIFEQTLLGEQLFTEVANSIKRYRKTDQPHYRCYITDIEVTGTAIGASSLVQDFYHKNALENLINEAFDTSESLSE